MVYKYKITKNIFTYLILIIIAFVFIFPIMWIFITSLKSDVQMFAIPPTFVPNPISFEHYKNIITEGRFLHQLGNSLLVSLISTTIALILGIPAAYGFSRFCTKRNNKIFNLITSVRMVPQILMVVPYFLVIRKLKLSDTILALILTYVPFQLSQIIWILKNFFSQVPIQIEEAAEIDGLNSTKRLLYIIIPLSKSSIGVSAMLAFLFSWNEFMFALSLTSTKAQTLTVGIAGYVTSFQTFWGKMSSSAFLFIIPAVILTLFFQKGMVKGLTAGAIKE